MGRFSIAVMILAGTAAAVLLACGGDDTPKVVVQFVQPTPTLNATPGLPTPTPEPVEVILSTEDVEQGGAILVSVTGPVQSGTVQFLGRALSLAQGERSLYTFAGVRPEDEPGTHALRVEFLLRNSTRATYDADILIHATDWAVDSVDFGPEQQALLDAATVEAENRTLSAVYGGRTPKKLWSGPWLYPIVAGITAPFGEQRSVNGGAPSGHHTGTDLGAAEGTEVYATNAGRVVMTRRLEIRGNMVIVDHGGGLFSGYAHLSSISVQEGQDVLPGDLIGLVGSTGLSTGAHLHWEMSAGGVLVDPVRFADGSNGF